MTTRLRMIPEPKIHAQQTEHRIKLGLKRALAKPGDSTHHSPLMHTLNAALEIAAESGHGYTVTVLPGIGASVTLIENEIPR